MNENPQNGPSEDVNKEKKAKNNRNLFIRKFNDSVSRISDNTQKNQLIEDICTQDQTTPAIQAQKEKVLADNREHLGEFDIDSINVFDLRRGLSKEFFRLENMRQTYLGEVDAKYELSTSQRNTLEKSLKKKSFSDIKKFTENISESESHMKSVLKKVPQAKEIQDIFEDLDDKKMARRIAKVKEPEKSELMSALGSISGGNFTSADLQILFTTNFLTKQEKLAFFKTYYQTISLDDAIKSGLISPADAKKKQKELVAKVLKNKETELDLDKDALQHIAQDVNNNEIFLSIDDLDLSEKTMDQYAKTQGFKKMEDQFEDFKKEAEQEQVKKGPQNLREFQEALKDKVIGIENLKDGNYVEVTKTDKTGEIKTVYKITQADNGKQGLILQAVGVGNDIDLNSSASNETFLYVNFLHLFEQKDSKIVAKFETDKELQKQVNDPSNPRFKENNFNSYTKQDLEDGEITDAYKTKLETEIEELKKELEQDKDNKFLKELIEKKEYRLQSLNSKSGNSLLQSVNLEKLTAQIDEIDPEGKKLGLHKDIFFESKEGTFSIDGIDLESQEIVVDTGGAKQKVSFPAFFAAIKKHKCKRVEKYHDFGAFLQGASQSELEIPDNYKFESGKFIAKDVENGDQKGDQEVNFFIGNENEVVKIESINGNTVTIRLGKKENNTDKDKKKGAKYTLAMQKKTETISLNEFKVGLVERKMKPDWQIGKNIKEKTAKGLSEDFHKSAGSRFFNRLSISDLLSAGKMWVDNIEEHLKKGSEVLAAKTALKWGAVLPQDVQNSLKIKVESFEREEMDKAVKSLSEIDSKIAAKMAISWLKDLDSPQYKKEAATLWAIGKYGHLTSKGDLKAYQGKFLFYQALGGRINDPMYTEFKKECEEKGGDTFNEEELVRRLLSDQCAGRHKASGIKRTSKLHKDYLGKWNGGIKDEIEDGYNDAKSTTSVNDIIDGAHGEFGTFPNYIGRAKGVLERGGNLEQLNEIYFVLLFSGNLERCSQAMLTEIKNQIEAGNPILLGYFGINNKNIGVANKAILEISKKIEAKEPEKYKGIGTEAQKIYSAVQNNSGDPAEIHEATRKFYKKYGKVLTRSLYMVDSDDLEFASTDKILLEEKNTSPVLAEYHKTLQEFAGERDFYNDGKMEYWGADLGLTGMNTHLMVTQFLKTKTDSGMEKPNVAPKVWKKIESDLYTANLKFNHPAQKEQYVEQKLRDIFSGLRINHSNKGLQLYNSIPPISTTLKKWGVTDIVGAINHLDSEDIKAGTSEFEPTIKNITSQILGGGMTVSEAHEEINFDEQLRTEAKALDPIANVSQEVKYANDEVFQESKKT